MSGIDPLDLEDAEITRMHRAHLHDLLDRVHENGLTEVEVYLNQVIKFYSHEPIPKSAPVPLEVLKGLILPTVVRPDFAPDPEDD